MLKVDLHTHTIKSNCGLSTLNENINEAVRKGMKILGIADHGPREGVSKTYFNMGYRIPNYVGGVRILFGAELSITNNKGELDLPENLIKKLDFVIAGIHPPLEEGRPTREYNTDAMINAIKNPYVKIISHPTCLKDVPVDIEKVSEAACRHNKLLELNCAHFTYEHKLKAVSIPATQEMIRIIQDRGHKLIVNSDAHNFHEIGDDSGLMKYKKILGFRDEDIINNDIAAFKRHIGI